jgi:hypothetical protein
MIIWKLSTYCSHEIQRVQNVLYYFTTVVPRLRYSRREYIKLLRCEQKRIHLGVRHVDVHHIQFHTPT